MGRWTDVAAWAGPIVNSGPGGMSSHRGVVIHTAEGSYDGTVAWQRNPAAEVGSHFVTAQDGRVVQLIDTATRSWCQSAGNNDWISIENAGWGSRGEALTPGQVEACARILARAHQEYGVPLQVSNSPTTPGLGWHGMGGTAWGGHTGCPGDAIRAQLPAIVARAAQIITPQPEDDMTPEQAAALDRVERIVTAQCTSAGATRGPGETTDRQGIVISPWPGGPKVLPNPIADLRQQLAAARATVTLDQAAEGRIVDGVVAKLATLLPTAATVADELAKRLGNG